MKKKSEGRKKGVPPENSVEPGNKMEILEFAYGMFFDIPQDSIFLDVKSLSICEIFFYKDKKLIFPY